MQASRFQLLIGPISIVPEVYYAEKGTRLAEQFQQQDLETPINPEDVELEFNLAYVEIPILAKNRLPFLSTEVIHPYIIGGPVFRNALWKKGGEQLDCSFNLNLSFGGICYEQTTLTKNPLWARWQTSKFYSF